MALEESLKYHSNQGKVVRLEELCLSNNGLSVLALQALTPVITLASCDLRDLDLSANNITVNTEAEVAVWESFLISFKSCCVLRRLDLSGNALGSRALEVLARVYAKEGVMDLLPPAHLVFDQSEERSPSVHLGRIQKTSIESDAENYHGGADTGPKVGKHKGSRLGLSAVSGFAELVDSPSRLHIFREDRP